MVKEDSKMTLRIFTPEEVAVFKSITEQRERSDRDDDCLAYMMSRGQKTLRLTGEAAEYGIGLPEQREIIHRLTDDGIIDADWVIAQGEQNTTGLKFARHDESWMWEKYGTLLMPINGDYDNYFFIQISFSRIRTIRENCVAEYSCELFYDEEQCCFYVECKNVGKIYYIRKLRSTMKPFKILLATFNSAHKHATRVWLNRNRATHVGKESVATRAFAADSVVRNELSPFVTLSPEDISIETEATLTFSQLKALEKA